VTTRHVGRRERRATSLTSMHAASVRAMSDRRRSLRFLIGATTLLATALVIGEAAACESCLQTDPGVSPAESVHPV